MQCLFAPKPPPGVAHNGPPPLHTTEKCKTSTHKLQKTYFRSRPQTTRYYRIVVNNYTLLHVFTRSQGPSKKKQKKRSRHQTTRYYRRVVNNYTLLHAFTRSQGPAKQKLHVITAQLLTTTRYYRPVVNNYTLLPPSC
jgi:hypothetical protein